MSHRSVEEPSLEELPDGVLVASTIFGNLDAFAELVRRYRRAALRTAASVVGNEAAEDIAQDALMLAYTALPDLDEPDRFAAWLNAITRNRALRWLRTENRLRRIDFDENLIGYLESASSKDQQSKKAAADLVEGLDQLPEEYAHIMRMKWLDEMTMEQIAAYTGLPLSTVKWRLHQGKKKLRAWSRPGGARLEQIHQGAPNGT